MTIKQKKLYNHQSNYIYNYLVEIKTISKLFITA